MQDELYLSGWEIEEISKILTKYEDEVNTLVEKAASERAAREAYDHPKLPKGFVTTECDIDPEAVSVDSEAHDMENGRDGLDGNAPEKDAPEKDDRDAQPPVDTDNR